MTNGLGSDLYKNARVDRIKDGDHIVIRNNIGHLKRRKVIRVLAKDDKTKLNMKRSIETNKLIGAPYGSYIRSELGQDIVDVNPLDLDWSSLVRAAEDEDHDEWSDDHLNDNNTSQIYTAAEIIKMKSELPLKELIPKLVKGNKSFHKRSKMSQEKYINALMGRHCDEIIISRACTSEVLKAYDSLDDGLKSGGLRNESLGFLMARANIGCGSKVMVYDHSMGVLTARVAQLIGDQGKAYRVLDKNITDKGCKEIGVDMGSRVPDDRAFLKSTLLRAANTPVTSENFNDYLSDLSDLSFTTGPGIVKVLADEEKSDELKEKMLKNYSVGIQKYRNKMRNWRELTLFEGVDSFVGVIGIFRTCSRVDGMLDLPSLTNLAFDCGDLALRFVQPGGTICLFCTELLPLQTLIGAIGKRYDWTACKIDQCFIRPWQFIEGRTHPVMKMEVNLMKGFILSARRLTEQQQ